MNKASFVLGGVRVGIGGEDPTCRFAWKNVGNARKIGVVFDMQIPKNQLNQENMVVWHYKMALLWKGLKVLCKKNRTDSDFNFFSGINQNSQIMFFSKLDRRVREATRWNLGCVYQQWTFQGKKGKKDNLSYEHASCHATFPFQLAGWQMGKEPMFSCFWWC